jgi:hypothetical protein
MANPITPVVDTDLENIKSQLEYAKALRGQSLDTKGENVSGFYVPKSPWLNFVQGLTGGGVESYQRGQQRNIEQSRNQQRQEFLAAMPSATETQTYDPESNPGTGPLMNGEFAKSPRALAQATQAWAANAPKGMESVQQFALQQALTAPEKQAQLEAQQQARRDQLEYQAQQELIRLREKAEADDRRDRERAQDKQDNIRLAASLRPGPSDIDMEIKKEKLNALRNPTPVKLSPTEQKELFETDEMMQASKNSVSLLNTAKGYSKDAYSGYFALPRAQAKSSIGGGSKSADATIQLNNILTGQGLESLKATFGAAPTEGERKILLEMQASADKTPKQREEIIDRAIAAANRRIQFNSQKADAIRNRTYSTPGSAPTAAPSGPVDFESLK